MEMEYGNLPFSMPKMKLVKMLSTLEVGTPRRSSPQLLQFSRRYLAREAPTIDDDGESWHPGIRWNDRRSVSVVHV
jgi:hypothetical protein